MAGDEQRRGEPFEAAVAVEAARLAALLDRNVPAPREPVDLPQGDPPAVRAFWRAIGWNARWPQQFRLNHPARDRSQAELARLLQQLVEESPGSPALKRGGLPEIFRLVDVDRDGVGFVVTDEDAPRPDGDPSLVGVVFDTGATFVPATSYLAWCMDELIALSFTGWFQEVVAPSQIAGAPAEKPFPVLSPTTRLLAPEVWLLPAERGAPASAERRVAFADEEAFARLFGRLPRRSG